MKGSKDLFYNSASDLLLLLANKTLSSVELLEATISRIEALDKKINAVVVRDFEQARLAAKAADVAIARGEKKPLLGLPITVKESFNVTGLPTTWGDPHYKNWTPTSDALAVTRLKEAGAIIIGKTNVPHMLMDWQSYNDIYGTTNNPWNLTLTPGGSSGGSAAALAAGFVSLELGSDLGGSIRIPAHYCGVCGHKPSINLVPMRGGGPPTTPSSPHLINDLVVAGPMARTAVDLELGLKILAGPDEGWDGKGYQLSLPPARHSVLNQFHVLVIDSHPLCPTEALINHAMENLVKQLRSVGVKISHDMDSLPDLAEITRTFVALFSAFIAGGMTMDEYQRTEMAAKKLPDNDMSLAAYALRGCTLTYRDWLMKTRLRNALRQQWRNLFKKFDVVICPVMPTVAFSHDHSPSDERKIEIDGKLFPYSDQYIWISMAALFGLPATVVPIGKTKSNLPIGVQIIGDYLEDYTTIQFGQLIERELEKIGEPI